MRILTLLYLALFFSACVGDDIIDDYVQPTLRITNPVSEIEEGTSYRFEHQFVNNVGQPETVGVRWSSGDAALLDIDDTGLANALAPGSTTVTATFTDEFDETVSVTENVEIGATTVVVEEMFRTGTARSTSSYPLEGEFRLTALETGELQLSFFDDYSADDRLPGLYVYLSNNPNSIGGAYEIGPVEIFEGAHDYVFSGPELAEYAYVLYFCKPFNVKVGDGPIE